MKFALDTNVYLHYKLFTERNWKELLNDDDLTLIIPSTVIKELDRHKYNSSDSRLSRRAQEIIVKFEMLEEKPLLKDISIEFLRNFQEIDWERAGLNPTDSDDRIIAELIGYMKRTNDEEINLISADFGMRLKAKNLGIKVVVPPNDWKRSVKDPRDKNILKLEKELAMHKNLIPKIDLFFPNEGNYKKYLKINTNKLLNGIMDDDFIKEEMAKINTSIEQKREEARDYGNSFLASTGMLSIAPEGLVKYENELSEYSHQYLEYLNEKRHVQELKMSIISIRLVLSNEGYAIAQDIDIWLQFPDEVEILKEDDLPSLPEMPEKPILPTSLNILTDFGMPFYPGSLYPPKNNAVMQTHKGPEIDEAEKNVRYWTNKLKHGMIWNLEPVFIRFPTILDMKNFRINYSINVDNLPKPKKGDLSIIFDQENSIEKELS